MQIGDWMPLKLKSHLFKLHMKEIFFFNKVEMVKTMKHWPSMLLSFVMDSVIDKEESEMYIKCIQPFF